MGTSRLLKRKARLERVIKQLKKEFIGLDDILDEIQTLISPWWLFPEAQRRPTVVNLWGMTGSGKTALVRRLTELLKIANAYVHFDIGEFGNHGEVWLKSMLAEDLIHHSGKPAVICLDEFQFARTLNETRAEVATDNLRIVWELLDAGRFYYNPEPSQRLLKRAFQGVGLIKEAISQGVIVQNGKVVDGLETFQEVFRGYRLYYYGEGSKKPKAGFFKQEHFLNGLYDLLEDVYPSRHALKMDIAQMDLEEIMHLLLRAAHAEGSMKEMDLSQSLIFVIGNLDEAYYMSSNINPDIHADEFHRLTQRITLADIKQALQARFRNEQIARLGNNHLIYPAFTEEQFRLFIQQQLNGIGNWAKAQFGLKLKFASGMIDLVYQEGVFPTQGMRPILTTVRHLVESFVTRMVCDLKAKNLKPNRMRWTYADGKYNLSAYAKGRKPIWQTQYEVPLRMNKLRASKGDDIQAHTAVHEAGHAVLAALTLRILPSYVLTQTADATAQGFCQIRFPEDLRTREVLHKDIIISLGGLIAERMVFGAEQTSTGVVSDLETASELANRAIKDYGMGADPISIQVESPDYYDSFFHQAKHGEEALAIVQKCAAEAEEILTRNKRVLLRMAQKLTENARMDQADIGACLQAYAADDWVRTEGFIEPEAYFRYKETIADQLAALESPDAPKEMPADRPHIQPLRRTG